MAMIRQYFADIRLEPNDSLSESLQELVNEAEAQFETPYVEVMQVIPHTSTNYTVILNLDFDVNTQEDQEKEQQSES
jgi:nitrate reductase cytochrome c-type subunit